VGLEHYFFWLLDNRQKNQNIFPCLERSFHILGPVIEWYLSDLDASCCYEKNLLIPASSSAFFIPKNLNLMQQLSNSFLSKKYHLGPIGCSTGPSRFLVTVGNSLATRGYI
jgi:hypothetical protein